MKPTFIKKLWNSHEKLVNFIFMAMKSAFVKFMVQTDLLCSPWIYH